MAILFVHVTEKTGSYPVLFFQGQKVVVMAEIKYQRIGTKDLGVETQL